MDKVEAPVLSLARKGQIRDLEGLRQQWDQIGLQRVPSCSQGWFVQLAAQRDVKAEHVQYVRIAPLNQVGVLPSFMFSLIFR